MFFGGQKRFHILAIGMFSGLLAVSHFAAALAPVSNLKGRNTPAENRDADDTISSRPPTLPLDLPPALAYGDIFEHLAQLQARRKGCLPAEPVRAHIKRCYLDWGTTLTSLHPGERRSLFDFLKFSGLEIHILSNGGSVDSICQALRSEGNLAPVRSVICTLGAELRGPDLEERDPESGVRKIVSFTSKPGYLRSRNNGPAIFFDDSARHFTMMPPWIVRVGVIGRNTRSLEDLLSRGNETAHYYLYSLHDTPAVKQIFKWVQGPDPFSFSFPVFEETTTFGRAA